MGSTGILFAAMVALVVWRCAAEELLDIVECDTPDGPLCAQSSEDGSLVLFVNPCVMDCTNYQLKAAGVGVEYTLINDSDHCDIETKFVRKCPDLVLESEDPDGDVDGEQPFLAEDGLPFALVPSFPDGLLGRLMASALSPSFSPQPEEGSLMLVDADFKVTVNININHPRPPGPPFQPPPPQRTDGRGIQLPPFVRLEYEVPEAVVMTAAGPRAQLTAAAALVTLVVAILQI